MLDASHAVLRQNANILDWRHVVYTLIKKRKRDVIGMRKGRGRGRGGGAAGGRRGVLLVGPSGSIWDLVKFIEMKSPVKSFQCITEELWVLKEFVGIR